MTPNSDPLLARSADELHRLLVLGPMVKNLTSAQVAYDLFAAQHEREPDHSSATALLMVTDLRWRKVAGALMRMIDESGLLDDDVVAGLAQTFVAAGDAVYWAVPAAWFEGGLVVVVTAALPAQTRAELEDESAAATDESAPDGPTLARRDVWPTLRRWAAARVVRRDSASWAGVRSRANELPSTPAAAVMSGLLDVLDDLPPPVRDLLLREALGWPHSTVRLAALRRVCDRDGADAAYALGVNDRDAEIRSWAESLRASTAMPTQEGLF